MIRSAARIANLFAQSWPVRAPIGPVTPCDSPLAFRDFDHALKAVPLLLALNPELVFRTAPHPQVLQCRDDALDDGLVLSVVESSAFEAQRHVVAHRDERRPDKERGLRVHGTS